MNNIKDILNKTYQRIGSTNGDTFHSKQIEGEFVIFSNGAKIKLTTLLADFQEVGNNSITENNQTTPISSSAEIDPDTFFESSGPIPEIKNVDKIQPIEAPSIIEGKLALNSTSQNNQQLGGLNLTDNQNTVQTNSEQVPQIQNRLPEWDSFDRVKKSEDVELNVTIKIKLPKARHIDAINDMYETSFTSYLAKKYTTDPINIQTQIREAIEEWVEIEMNGGKHPKKKTSKIVKKKNKEVTTEKEFVLPGHAQNTVKPIESGTAAAMFGQEQIDKDVTKLAIIVEHEQYIAAKEYFSKLEPSHKDYYRFEGMIALWEDENNLN